MKVVLVFLASLLLVSCVYSPKKVTYYDQKCKIHLNKMELESRPMKMNKMGKCTNEACFINMLIPGIVTAGTVIVSGSIVVTANTVYWLEKSIKCA